jgi:hypothetical protein
VAGKGGGAEIKQNPKTRTSIQSKLDQHAKWQAEGSQHGIETQKSMNAKQKQIHNQH